MTGRVGEVAQFMRDNIESGVWKPRCRIPSQNELVNELKASSRVVGHATAALREQGYLWTLPHKGSYVRPPKDWQREVE